MLLFLLHNKGILSRFRVDVFHNSIEIIVKQINDQWTWQIAIIIKKKFHTIETFLYLCTVKKILTYGGFFEAFIATLKEQEVRKIDYLLALLATSDRVPTKFVKHLRDGLYELIIKTVDAIYRVFFIFDNGNIVVLFNGIKKKSQKTPKKELEKALKIKEAYYADKQS